MKKILLITLTFIGLFLVSSSKSAHAATLYWVGNDGANASVASNWKTTNPATCGNGDASAIPGASDTMNFDADCDNGAVVDSSFSTTVDTITISSGYAGTITLSNPLTVTTAFSQAAGTFTAGAQTFDINGTYSLTGGTFTASSTNTYVGSTFTVSGSPTFNHNSGTFNFDTSSATLTCVSSSLPAFNLVVVNNGGNAKTVGSTCSLPLGTDPSTGRITLNGTLSGSGTLTVGTTFTFNSSTSAISGFTGLVTNRLELKSSANVNLGSYTTVDVNENFDLTSGTFTAPTGTMTVAGAFSIASGTTFNANSGTLTFDSNGSSATIACNNTSFSLVTFNNTGTKTVNSDCSLPLGSSPVLTGSSIILNGGILSGTGTLTKTAGTLFMNAGATFSGFTGTSLFIFTVQGATVDLTSYTSFAASSTVTVSSGSLTLPSGADLNGALTISGGTFTAPSGTMTLAGSLTVSGGTGTFNANGGTITFDGSTATIGCTKSDASVISFNLVTFANTGTKTVSSGCSLPLGNSPTILASVTLSGTLSGSGLLTVSSGTLTLNSGATLNTFTGLTTFGLTISGGTIDFTSYNPVTVFTSFSLTSGTLTAPSGTMRVDGNWTNSGGTFNHNNGTMIWGRTNQTNHNISGSTTFFNLTKIVTSADQLSFAQNTTQTILGTLTFTGTSNGKLTIRADNNTPQWYINAQGGRVLSNLIVSGSNNTNSNSMVCSSCTDSGNNTNWNFINGSNIQFSLNYPSGDSHITNTSPTYRWSKASVSNNSAITKYELYIQPKDSQDRNTGTALYIDNIAPYVSDNKQYQYNPTYTLYDDGDYLNLTPNNYILPVGKYNFRVVAHDSAGNIAENSYNFFVDSTRIGTPPVITLTKYTNQKLNISQIDSSLDQEAKPVKIDSKTETPTPPSVSSHETKQYNHTTTLGVVLLLAGAGLIWIPKLLKRKLP